MRRRRRRYSNRFMNANQSESYRFMIPVVCALAALVVAVALGTMLGKTAEDAKAKEYDSAYRDIFDSPYSGEVLKTPENYCGAVFSEDAEIGNLAVFDELKSKGHTSVLFNIRNADGSLTFTSDAAYSLGIAVGDGIDLSKTVKNLTEFGFDVATVFYSDALSRTGVEGKACEAFEVAVIAEAGICGVDEVILMGLDHYLGNEEKSERVFTFLSTIRANTDASLIVSVPLSLLKKENGNEYITKLARCVDGIAVDLSGVDLTSTDDPYKICDLLSEVNINYHIERYNARLLIPVAAQDALELLRFAGYTNIATIN